LQAASSRLIMTVRPVFNFIDFMINIV